MCPLPAGKCVGRKALMHQTKSAGHIGIDELAIETRDLRGEQQAFVDDSAARERRNVKSLPVFDAGFPHLILSTLTHHVQLAFKGGLVHARARPYENLLDVGLRGSGNSADG